MLPSSRRGNRDISVCVIIVSVFWHLLTFEVVFLTQLVAVIIFLATEVSLETHMLDMPCNYALQKAFPEGFASGHHTIELHPFVAKVLLLVAITTLLLFFASGLYEEKIAYANR